jgi:hypothetical protein
VNARHNHDFSLKIERAPSSGSAEVDRIGLSKHGGSLVRSQIELWNPELPLYGGISRPPLIEAV